MSIAVEQASKPNLQRLMTGFNASAAHEETPPVKKLTANEELGRQKSGHVIENISIVGNTGEYANDKDEKEYSIKKRQRDRIISNAFSLTNPDILSSLNDSINFHKTLMSMDSGFYKPVESKDMLRNDKGAIVKTLEEKQEMEHRGKNCSGLLSQDEVAQDPVTGMMITKQDAMINMIIQERIDYQTKIFAKVQKGEMSAEDLPEDLKKELTDRQYSNKPYTPTFFDRINIGQSALSMSHTELKTSGTYILRQEAYITPPAPAPAL